jgi:hypothetical protein
MATKYISNFYVDSRMNEYWMYYYGVGHLCLTYWYFHQNYQLIMGQEVWLMNPQSVRQKVTVVHIHIVPR